MKTWIYKHIVDENGVEVTKEVTDEEFEAKKARQKEIVELLREMARQQEDMLKKYEMDQKSFQSL